MNNNTEYNNPVDPAHTVEIYAWEYAKLVQNSTTLNLIMKLYKSDNKYHVLDLLEAIAKDEEMEVE